MNGQDYEEPEPPQLVDTFNAFAGTHCDSVRNQWGVLEFWEDDTDSPMITFHASSETHEAMAAAGRAYRIGYDNGKRQGVYETQTQIKRVLDIRS